MSESNDSTPRAIRRQVVGWVLVLPLLVSFIKLPLPFPLVFLPGLATIAASVYGVRFAKRHASRRVTVMALIATLLNVISLIGMGTASFLKGLYYLSWVFWYPYYANWVYWTF